MSIGQMLQKLIFSNPRWAHRFQSTVSPSFFEKKGRSLALSTFKKASQRVPAYQEFLKDHQVEPASVQTWDDFKKLPVIDKKTYLQKYPLEKLCLDGNLHQMYTLSVSSGSTGEPTFWPMLPTQTQMLPPIMELFYTHFFKVQERPTLAVITLALGTWAAGELAAEASRAVARNPKYPLTVVTPGLELAETLKIIKKIAPKYEQTLLMGYPPFVKDVLEAGEQEGVDWPNLKVKILIGGEAVSEEWRDWTMHKVDSRDPTEIISLFATADAGIIGFETPLTIRLRRLARGDSSLAAELFGTANNLPTLVQFNPMAKFIEEMEGELIITADLGLPLVRYNIQDRGGVIPFGSIPQRFLRSDDWHLPLFYCWGRANAATLYGLNVYTENIQVALEKKELLATCTGRFKFGTVYTPNQNQFLQVVIEVKPGVEPSQNLTQTYQEVLVSTLGEKSSEYNRLIQEKGSAVYPLVKLIRFQQDVFSGKDGVKNKYLETK